MSHSSSDSDPMVTPVPPSPGKDGIARRYLLAGCLGCGGLAAIVFFGLMAFAGYWTVVPDSDAGAEPAAVAVDVSADALSDVLRLYFMDINREDYESAYQRLDPAWQAGQGLESWQAYEVTNREKTGDFTSLVPGAVRTGEHGAESVAELTLTVTFTKGVGTVKAQFANGNGDWSIRQLAYLEFTPR